MIYWNKVIQINVKINKMLNQEKVIKNHIYVLSEKRINSCIQSKAQKCNSKTTNYERIHWNKSYVSNTHSEICVIEIMFR